MTSPHATDGKPPSSLQATESTPLLHESSRQSLYISQEDTTVDKDVDPSLSSTLFAPEEDPALLSLSRVTSIPQGLDVEPNLERLPSAPVSQKQVPGDAEDGVAAGEPTGYASRFINVSPMRFWLIFSGILMGYVIGFFDSTLMASSHPVITSYFHASNSASWLSTAFLLTSTAFLPLFGRISDTFGRKPVYLFAIAIFFVTTAWCAAAQSMFSFIAARAFCGLGAGGVFSMGMILSSDLVRLEYRGVYQSYINLCLGIGGCLGLAFGGFLCDQVGWRAVVFVRYERTVERGVMPISLLVQEPRASLIFGNFFGAISVNTMVFNAPLYFQAVKLATPTDSGLRLIGSTLAVTISSVSTGFIITWTKRLKPTIIFGDIFLLLGGCAAASMGVGTPDWLAMVCVSLSSLGQGCSFPSLMVSVLATTDQEDQAVATTTLGLWRNLGSVMGVATSSWIFQNTLVYQLEEMVTGPNKEDVILLVRKSVQAIAKLDSMHQQQVIGAYAAALRATFFSAAIWGALMLILHLRVRVPRLGTKA
ncbi:MFS transporter [Aspergillus luchuensis]|uniref:MFS transporter n=1 Tax=Aspergillus kawachii TaxID=1069201 RepID=A0A146FRD1_ASPKA|nr:MFS transporter [Aspergillus luchuensis]